MVKVNHYEVKDGTLIRKKKTCPKCGDGVFLAEHANRISCGKCGYTEFKKKEEPKVKETKEKEPLPEPDTGAPSLFEE
jgi:small subunit ribosomal protein S27Ae